MTWTDQAACRGKDTNLWFSDGFGAHIAVRICSSCPVQHECRGYALGMGDELKGIFGGMSERERRQLLARRPAASW
jgi:WhiB family redox-sensing transcriptional regulator